MTEFLATTWASSNVDPQQGEHPVGSRLGLIVGRRRPGSEQLATSRQELTFNTISKKAVVPNVKEAVWQDMLEEATEEFLGGKNVRLALVAVTAITIAIMHLAVPASKDAVIADRHAMSITSQVVQQLAWAGKRCLGVDYPCFFPTAS